MPYVIKKGRQRLGFDDRGDHEWKDDRLDAIRFVTQQEARECRRDFVEAGSRVVKVGRWDGHYETYRGYEIQVFRDKVKKPGGRRWRYRIGPQLAGRAFEHSPGSHGYTSPESALQAAQSAVNQRPRVSELQS